MSTFHQIAGCESAARKADVVFVHGLGGDAFATWRHGKEDATSWLHWLVEEFPKSAFGRLRMQPVQRSGRELGA